mgnify:CR=1 FL=1
MSEFRFQQRDFLGILNDMKLYYKDKMGDKWTDLTEADPAIALLEAFAYSCKNLHYYVDQQKRESDIVTAVRARNVYWKSIRDGYTPHGYIPSSGTIKLVFSEDTDAGVIIPKHTNFQTNYDNPDNNLIVTTLEDQVLSENPIVVSNKNEFEVSVVQGIWRTETHTRADITQNGYIKLTTEKVATSLGMVEFSYTRNSGEEPIIFEQVEDVYTDYRTGYFFSVHPLFLRNTTTSMVQLPYNWPSLFDTDGTIEISYLETEGSSGYIPKSVYNESTKEYTGGVSELNDVLYDNDDPPNNISSKISSIYNVYSIAGGQDIESVNSIKINAKSAIRELDTLVTLQDYSDYVRRETGVNVSCMDISTDASIPGRYVYIYIELDIDQTAGYKEFDPPASMSVEDYIYRYMNVEDWNLDDPELPHSYSEFWKDKYNDIVEKVNQKKGRRDVVVFQTPTYYQYNIAADIYLSESGDSPEVIMEKIETELKKEFGQVPQIGNTHYMSKMISILQESSERVKSVVLTSPDTDIKPADTQIPVYSIEPNAFRFLFLSGEDSVTLPVPQEEQTE